MLVTIAPCGLKGQERAVGLVGLGDEHVTLAVVRAQPGAGQLPADRERGVQAGVLQRDGEHRGGRGLAVGAGHAHRPAIGHQGGQCIGPADHRNAGGAGGDDLGVVRPDGGGDHDRGRPPRGSATGWRRRARRRCAHRARPGRPAWASRGRRTRTRRTRGRPGSGQCRSSRRHPLRPGARVPARRPGRSSAPWSTPSSTAPRTMAATRSSARSAARPAAAAWPSRPARCRPRPAGSPGTPRWLGPARRPR